MKLGQPLPQSRLLRSGTAVGVDFGTIAGRKDEGFFGQMLRQEITMCRGQLIGRKCDLLAHLDGRTVMT